MSEKQKYIARRVKNILLVTLAGRHFNMNYGAILQAYALQNF